MSRPALPRIAWEPESELLAELRRFMAEHVYPRERELELALDSEVGPGRPYPGSFLELRAAARERGLLNLHLADPELGRGLTQSRYAPLCEETGRASQVAPAIFNSAPPDSGNVEMLLRHAGAEQQRRWVEPRAPATANCASAAAGCRPTPCSVSGGGDSRSPSTGLGRVACTTRCGRSGRPSGRWSSPASERGSARRSVGASRISRWSRT